MESHYVVYRLPLNTTFLDDQNVICVLVSSARLVLCLPLQIIQLQLRSNFHKML